MLRKPELSASLMGHLARMQTLPFTLYELFVGTNETVRNIWVSVERGSIVSHLKGPRGEDFAVLRQFCVKSITYCL